MRKLLVLTAIAVLGFAGAATVAHADGHGGKGGKMFEKADKDGDGKISKEEFLNSHEEKFSKMDGDGDGYITKDEAKEARGHMKDKIKERRAKWKENKESAE